MKRRDRRGEWNYCSTWGNWLSQLEWPAQISSQGLFDVKSELHHWIQSRAGFALAQQEIQFRCMNYEQGRIVSCHLSRNLSGTWHRAHSYHSCTLNILTCLSCVSNQRLLSQYYIYWDIGLAEVYNCFSHRNAFSQYGSLEHSQSTGQFCDRFEPFTDASVKKKCTHTHTHACAHTHKHTINWKWAIFCWL